MGDAEFVSALAGVLPQAGIAGAVIVVLALQVRFLQTKLVDVLEKNTLAMVELKAVIDKCQFIHKSGVRG